MTDLQQSRWQPTRRQLLWASVAVVLLTIAILIGYRYGITLWDWIELLIVPAVIAGGGIWFNRQQRERELENAEQRAETDRQIANQHRQDELLQAYLDHVSTLLLENDLRSPEGDPSQTTGTALSVARARTLTVLTRLDGDRR